MVEYLHFHDWTRRRVIDLQGRRRLHGFERNEGGIDDHGRNKVIVLTAAHGIECGVARIDQSRAL